MATDKARDENMIAALKRERAGYVQRGEDDRVRQVDDELVKLGVPVETPKGRTSREQHQSTADQGKQQHTAKAATPEK